MPTDPLRVLGLPRDATLAEIKQAYRRLAKANHPDTAGEAAIPRFLEIQTAYETLVGGSPARRGRARPGSNPAPREPWRADADRARAAREAYERARERPRRGTRPPGPDGAGAGGGPPRGPRSGKRATLGSTSYDGADQEPFDPDWAGASWYGTTSGTYWTLNPKEYADPRKHGPEYQARARRGARGAAGATEPPAEGADPGATDAGATEPGSATEAGAADPGTTDFGTTDFRPTDGASTPSSDQGWSSGAAPRGGGRTDPFAAGRGARARRSGRRHPSFATVPPAPPPSPATPRGAGHGEPTLLRFLDEARGSVSGRIGLALIGWLPIGIVLAVALGESTGCIRYAAECQGPFGAATLIGQGSVIVLLLLLPRVAAVATLGTIAMLGAAIPAAAVLSISGGARDPAGATSAFAVVLAVAWFVGVGVGLVRAGLLAVVARRPPVP
ncbi:MAG TPA: J domain-containing protein [Candidatus Limnocylindrales bacterium]|nr:J domain-containing protein [Candidatus Limnocylindrales bacterium]